ncbi:MAG TPA: zinc-ribbon domain-containing protein [Pyrinomonadaceae bacterium]|nr:zinc-ribbon domain-containing protein [Pyrinomonadaceae bacterium]
MFCPSCGSEERQTSQFCRACGTDLRAVRVSLERPDSVTASAVTAREEIGRAVAAKIREVQDARELKKVAEDVLPQIEKFLESPEEKRMRRVRSGVVVAAAGLGGTIFMVLMSAFLRGPDSETFLGIAGMGVACFLIGIGLIINALFFTKPRGRVENHSLAARDQNLLDGGYTPPSPAFKAQTTSNLAVAPNTSVTEQTTRHLKS